ncbi:probable serine/threonine-protein kinase At1g54610 [Zingiber officinale]|uniref:[RNA-polymerase]-subunit kinase n=1 Tax=Zingiber officinale TaxID=94328 RepID=A0A8J5GX04_ZINOF|nr:probable serine/threonine-protein kinase At1g54610 [Zingiber officinale]XP_042376745.1 probable serine/threonine-protein kinase At1g54610 [Zingiber officinale]XP_042376746.1 probable serine/threonine-protein kinase At1g54610 [Zingiber officinale]XP_042376747.1 probable serine/threonine-protein kinase At1g54610 [Zingiber officinale]XP_042376748.1 probable serine/threonine-protein kinase At1g54610 [Zingiber officinale]XP_042376749.1 probable serine/threonine-protein kinase At1g54610 [Zingiber
MGCLCSKGLLDDDGVPDRSKSLNRIVTFSQKDEVVTAIVTATLSGNHSSARFSSKRYENSDTSSSVSSEEEEDSTAVQSTGHVGAHNRRATVDVGAQKNGSSVMGSSRNIEGDLGIGSVPNGLAGEQVAAGWPSWLTDVAGEAINGWLPRRGDSFEKLDKIGEGTYSHVFRARDLETGKIVALKKVRFVNMDPESVCFMAREIRILRRLDHPNVIKLEGIITSRMSCNLYLIFEYMEHDLAGLAARSSVRFTEPQVKCYVKQLLEGLDHCHSRGVLHRDIKGSNLLINNSGILRIADFGLATLLTVDQNQQLTSRVVTLWYRPPELLLGATEYGAAVDLWSSGCILAELFAGRPIMPGRTEVEQLHKIFKLCGSPSEEYWEKSKLPHATIFKPQHQYRCCLTETFKDFPPTALSLLDYLLAIEPEKRGTVASALQSKFFTTMPFACDPSSLPKYPPSKEYDAKLQDEARRQRAAARASESVRPHNRVSRAMPAQERQNSHGYLNTKSIGKKYEEQDDAASGFPMEPPGGPSQNVSSHPGIHPNALVSTLSGRKQEQARHAPSRTYSSMRVPNGLQLRPQTSYRPHLGGADFSDISGSFATRGNAGSRQNQLDGGRHAEHKKNDIVIAKEPAQVYGHPIRRIHYSGPLMPPGGNMEDMLKEHEKQIQQAVRKSRKNF